MRNYKCASCGKNFDPEKEDICPACGAAVAPSVMTRIERKRTAQRMRAEGKFNYDDHCHEDDSWKNRIAALGYRVVPILKGLGEYPKVRNMICRHAAEAEKLR